MIMHREKHKRKVIDERKRPKEDGYTKDGYSPSPPGGGGRATWLILPVVICLSQRLSHACVSINSFVL